MGESDIKTLYLLTKKMSDEMIELHKEEYGNEPVNMTVPILMGDDMIVTIERGPKTSADIAILKAMNA